jgi:hypothetical protein
MIFSFFTGSYNGGYLNENFALFLLRALLWNNT